MTLLGHQPIDDADDDRGRGWSPTISYFPDGQQMASSSSDGTLRIWNLQTGKEVEEARAVYGQPLNAVAVSRDARWVIAASGEFNTGKPWEIKARGTKKEIKKTFEGHSQEITTDISHDGKLLASGS